MNKLIELLRGCEHDGAFIPVNEVKRLMQEYGKYCAKKLYYTINLDPLEKWWLEFQREEETK